MWPFRQRENSGLGPRGERLARRFLKSKGLRILARNYRCPAGEIDLIVLDKAARAVNGAETVAMVEVKTRSSDRHTDPESAVGAEKRRRLRKAAEYYLSARDAEGFNIRFDVVSVLFRDGQEPQVRHIPNAF